MSCRFPLGTDITFFGRAAVTKLGDQCSVQSRDYYSKYSICVYFPRPKSWSHSRPDATSGVVRVVGFNGQGRALAQPRLRDPRNTPRASFFLGGYRLSPLKRFAAVTAEVFAASRRSWRRSLPLRGGRHGGGLFTPTQQQRKKSISLPTSDFRLFIAGTYFLGVCAPSRYLCRKALFVRNRRKVTPKQAPKIPPPMAVEVQL